MEFTVNVKITKKQERDVVVRSSTFAAHPCSSSRGSSGPSVDGVRLLEHHGCDRRSIIEHRVLAKRADAGGDQRAPLSGVEEDVPRHQRRSLEPVRVVKRSTIGAEYAGETLKGEKQLGPAGRTEIDGDPLSAAFRRHGVGRWRSRRDFKLRLLEDRLHHVRRPGGPLTKSAIAECHAYRLRRCCVTDRAAKAATVVQGHYKLLTGLDMPYLLCGPDRRISAGIFPVL